MAASGMHVGHKLHKKCRVLLTNFELLWGKRTFVGISSVRLQALDATKSGTESTEQIVIPRKKVWSKEAVLETLASTVRRDPTAYPYQFQDDPYLSPKNFAEFNLYTLSQESGKSAAKYFINSYPKFFTKDFAEPHIPCLMPDTISLHLDEVSEAALKERISLRKVKDAVDMYDQILQAGTSVSMETTHDLLDLICLFCDKDPVQEEGTQTEYNEAMKGLEVRKKRGSFHQSSEFLKLIWRDQNNAERIFNMLPEKDTRCYSALIRGMVKHGAYTKAFSMYTDLLNNRLTADVHIFNALLSAAPEVRDKYSEKWDLITEILNQMSQQKIQPNLQTFNSILKAMRRCGFSAKTLVLQVLSEMKSLQIVPSLASFHHVLAVFYQAGMPAKVINILQEILSDLAGKRFTCQDPDDVLFFSSAMRICLDSKDLELAYEVQRLVEVGENWRLMGNSYRQNLYYSRFFTLLCMMENIDEVLKWYRELIPSVFYPRYDDMRALLQALDSDSRLEMLPTIWKDILTMRQDNKLELIEELLALMARDKHSPEVQESFAACALDVKSVFVGNNTNRFSLEWSSPTLTHITSLLLRANKIQEAWEMMQLFKANNRVPSYELFEDFLSVCRQDGSAHRAVELVQLSAAFCLQATPSLAKRTLADFDLKEEQRIILSELETVAQPAD
ncbi:small ribosomal subunit protein mS39 [Nerophis lumbriciformis]|uniref:small ribosomal subunit protein mS39 n=1 Tax=Nerophis lumbriciformis TaxID=546530 RepID=UPI002ADFB19E|nr:small ribosomal subunit protein mS39-like [Nerophis lumbriciformis]XP_061835549.1 small ribosomal subunit protein mS39-like [Nerophis lumbriciformis]